MTNTTEKALPAREILLVGPYGVLGTGVLDAAAANPAWHITTAARRPAPTYRASTALRHINVDLLDRKGTMKVFSDLSTITDLVFAAYVEKPTMAETVEPNTRMLANTLDLGRTATERRTEFIFESLYLLTQGWLCHMKQLGGFRKVELFGYCDYWVFENSCCSRLHDSQEKARSELTADQQLRQTTFLGWRDYKKAKEVVSELPYNLPDR